MTFKQYCSHLSSASGNFIKDPARQKQLWDAACADGRYDAVCAEGSNAGCDAGGVGQMCRWCGFDGYPPCPDPAPASYRDPDVDLTYEVCVGSTRLGCQALPFSAADVRSPGQFEVGGLALQCGASYHVAVRATNCGGLQRTVVSTSASKLCCDPPALGTLALVDVASGTPVTYLGPAHAEAGGPEVVARWSGFEDGCSGLRAVTLTLSAEADASATLHV